MLATSAQLARLPSGCEVAVAGLVIARQRPGTAKGTMFLLFEDEFGTINLIVAKAVYERHRHAGARRAAAARPRAPGALAGAPAGEPAPAPPRSARAGGAGRPRDALRIGARADTPVINVIVRELAPLERFLSGGAEDEPGTQAGARVHRLPGAADGPAAAEEPDGTEVGSSMRAAAPPVQSFAMGRRR